MIKKILVYSYGTLCLSCCIYFSKKELRIYEKYIYESDKTPINKFIHGSTGFLYGFVIGGTIVPIIFPIIYYGEKYYAQVENSRKK